MKHLEAMTFSRWIATGILIVTPFTLGCGAKSGAEPDARPATASQPDNSQPDNSEADNSQADNSQADTSAFAESAAPPELTAAPVPAAVAGDPDKPRAGTGQGAPGAEIAEFSSGSESGGDEAAGAEPPPRPKSIFRSIGRAIRKGVTDATGTQNASSADVSTAPAEATSEPPAEP